MRIPDPRYSLVIFDLDGTLVDSFPWFLRVVNDVAHEFGFKPLAAEDIPAMRGSGARDILRHLDVPLWKVPRIASHMRRLKRAQIAEFRLFPGVSEMLASLRNQGIRLALVSSDSEANARIQLGPSASYFSDIDCGASLFGKSAKFRRIARRTGVEPSNVIAIGDEMRDFDAAEEAGIAFGGVSWGYSDPASLRARKPALWFDAVADITHTLMRGENAASKGSFDLHARQ